MKKYMAPEMEMMDFIVDKNITGVFGSDDPYNDDSFGGWPKK